MYNYSPIKKLYIQNFRNLGNVEIDFTESPIVTLVGENEAGKTSVIKAFSACALHANPREQKDWIRDNTKMFGVAIDLQDGTRIVRIKEASGINSYQIIGEDGKVKWSTNKITDGLPVEIQNLMGLIEEPETKEFLHIRTYEDKLLFVVTPNSTNYKVMYNALKVEQLTKAIKNGSVEVNGLKSDINTNEIKIQTLTNQARAIKIIDTESIVSVKNRLIQQMSILDKLEKAKALRDKVDGCERQLGALALIDKFKLESINELSASKLSSVCKILNRHNEVSKLRDLYNTVSNSELIDTGVVNKLSNFILKKEMLSTKIANAGALVHVSEISEISEIEIMQLNKIITLLKTIRYKESMSKALDTNGCDEIDDSRLTNLSKLHSIGVKRDEIIEKQAQLDSINTYIEQVHDYMKQCGVAVETCPKCGESVVFDVDKM